MLTSAKLQGWCYICGATVVILNGLFGRRLYTGFMSGQHPPPNQLPSLAGRVIYVLIGVAALLLGMRDLLKSAS